MGGGENRDGKIKDAPSVGVQAVGIAGKNAPANWQPGWHHRSKMAQSSHSQRRRLLLGPIRGSFAPQLRSCEWCFALTGSDRSFLTGTDSAKRRLLNPPGKADCYPAEGLRRLGQVTSHNEVESSILARWP